MFRKPLVIVVVLLALALGALYFLGGMIISKVAVAVGEPVRVQRDLDEAGREDARVRIEEALLETDRAAAEVISLPMHTELTEEQQTYIAEAVLAFVEQRVAI